MTGQMSPQNGLFCVIPGTGHAGHTGTGHTGHTGTGHTGTGYRSDSEHSVCRSQSVRSDAVDHRSTLLNCTLQEHRSDLRVSVSFK